MGPNLAQEFAMREDFTHAMFRGLRRFKNTGTWLASCSCAARRCPLAGRDVTETAECLTIRTFKTRKRGSASARPGFVRMSLACMSARCVQRKAGAVFMRMGRRGQRSLLDRMVSVTTHLSRIAQRWECCDSAKIDYNATILRRAKRLP